MDVRDLAYYKEKLVHCRAMEAMYKAAAGFAANRVESIEGRVLVPQIRED